MSPLTQSATQKSRYENLLRTISSDDVLGIMIVADPDAIASALALKRLLWRKVRQTRIFRVNTITRSDNLAMIRCLGISISDCSQIDTAAVTKWAIVDAQPHHQKEFERYDFSIVIDHHPPAPDLRLPFMDIREDYGANASILTEYLRAADITPSTKLATALFYGIKTDTDNFVRTSTAADIKAFRYLYPHVNLNFIKKIELSEINTNNLTDFRHAFETLQFIGDTAYIHMGIVQNTDSLVILADFFMKMAEAEWCMVSGIHEGKIIIIIRNAGFRLDAGKVAARLFGKLGSAGGHRNAARVEIPVPVFTEEVGELAKVNEYIREKIKER